MSHSATEITLISILGVLVKSPPEPTLIMNYLCNIIIILLPVFTAHHFIHVGGARASKFSCNSKTALARNPRVCKRTPCVGIAQISHNIHKLIPATSKHFRPNFVQVQVHRCSYFKRQFLSGSASLRERSVHLRYNICTSMVQKHN